MRILADSVSEGIGAIVFGARNDDPLLGISRDVGGAKRPASSCRSALVSGCKLLEDWLALGALCSHAVLRADHDGVLKQRTGSGTSDGLEEARCSTSPVSFCV